MSHAGLTASHEGSSTNLANNNSVAQESDSDDRVALAQALLQRCLQKDTLLCELYMQLIKQVITLNSSNLPYCMILYQRFCTLSDIKFIDNVLLCLGPNKIWARILTTGSRFFSDA